MTSPARKIQFVLLCAIAASASAQTTTQSSIDRSLPTAAYQTLLNAIDRDDSETVADSVLFPLALNDSDRRLMAERLIVSTKLLQSIVDKFGNDVAKHAEFYAELTKVPREDLAALKFEFDDQLPREINARAHAQAPAGRFVSMVRPRDEWKLDRSGASIPLFAYMIEDAQWRNAIMRRALNDLKAGKIADENVLHAALVPAITQTPPTTNPSDRSVPSNVPWAIQIAVEAGDEAEVADCYTRIGGDPQNLIRSDAHFTVAAQKLNHALHKKFGPAIGDRLATNCGLNRNDITQWYANVKWAIDGDVARGERDEYRLDSSMRMRLYDGKWRIEIPPDRFADAIFAADRQREQESNDRFAQRRKDVDEVLAHLDRYADPGSVLDVLDPVRSEYIKRDPTEEKAQQTKLHADRLAELEKAKREFAAIQASLPPQERAQQLIAFSMTEQILRNPQGDALPDSTYFADGDAGSAYVRARLHRRKAAGELTTAVDRQLDSGAERLLYDFTLINAADDLEALEAIKWTVEGDRATGKMEDVGHIFWIPSLRKAGLDWKIDLSGETDGNPAAAAARAESEAKAIEHITADVKALKFQTIEQVRAAMRAANIHGTGKPM